MLNELADAVELFDNDELEVLGALIDDGYDTEQAIKAVENKDYTLYSDGHTMEDVAIVYCDECGMLNGVPENLRYYFDYEAYGRDMEMEGTFLKVSNGYVEIHN